MKNCIKFLAALLCIAFFSNNILAQESNDPAATAILKNLKEQYESFGAMTASFDLEIELPEQDVEVQSGTFYQSGDSYRIDMEAQTIISNGKVLWVYLKENNEVQINSAEDMDEDEDFISPKDLFNFYENDDFYYALTAEEEEQGKMVQQIEFKPLDEYSEYFKMRLTVEKKTNKVKRLKVFSKDGSRFTLKLKDLKHDAIDTALFTFDKSKYPEGIHVEDLRID